MEPISPEKRFEPRNTRPEIAPAEVSRAFCELLPGAEPNEVTELRGGFRNGNFRVRRGDDTFLVRIFGEDPAEGDRELALLRRVREAHSEAVPAVLAAGSLESRRVSVMEFVDGPTLQSHLAQPSPEANDTLFRVGEALARFHGIHFSQAGLFGPDGELADVFDDFPEMSRKILMNFLAGTAGERLDKDLRADVLGLVVTEWQAVRDTFPGAVLTHCDFNPKNILVRPDGTPCVVDWEFSMAAHPMMDVANFLRFSEDYTEPQKNAFLEGYGSVAGRLTPQHLKAGRLLDLVAMAQFLSPERDYPMRFATAREVIARTVEADG